MIIPLTYAQTVTILQRFGRRFPPRPGRGVMLPGEAGAIENQATYGYQWVGTESDLVRLSHRLGVIRRAR